MEITSIDMGSVGHYYHLGIEGRAYYISTTLCCALTVIKNLTNATPEAHIKALIDHVKKTANENAGATNILINTFKSEDELGEKLIKCGFTKLTDKITRRFCYDRSNLTLFVYSI